MTAIPQIFVSYARPDKENVERLWYDLSDAGFKPWMDTKNLRPGELFKPAIKKALRESDFFLACLSKNSIDRRGFLQVEIREALDLWKERLIDDIYLIPVRLDDCKVPEGLNEFNWVNLFEEEGWSQLVDGIYEGLRRRMETAATEEDFKGLLVPNARGVSLLQAIRSAGLGDIENREDTTQLILPPVEFYDQAKREVVITGISTALTFHIQNVGVIHKILNGGKMLYVLILHPNSSDIKKLKLLEDRSIQKDIEGVIEVIKSEKLNEKPNFQIRFMQNLPPFTSVMVDGDVLRKENPEDQTGQIRVQVRTTYGSQHKGIVFQFKKTIIPIKAAFDYFAKDLREQWSHAKAHPEFFVL